MLSPAVSGAEAYLYVPDSQGSRVTVIDQRTRKIVRVIRSGFLSPARGPVVRPEAG